MSKHDRAVSSQDPERLRLRADDDRSANWKRWGPYLSERQWGTVREDYSADGDSWAYLPHDHARSRTYRWGEDGLLGICDRQCRLCFGLALWNGKDPILKERLFGLSGPEGNHGEDVKEAYFYLDNTPTHSYMKGLYKYPQREFPYQWLKDENKRRGRDDPEFELEDTGIFDDNRYWDVVVEYAKDSPNDVCIRITVHNRGPDEAEIHVLPTLWFRNTWAWNRTGEGYAPEPRMELAEPNCVIATGDGLGAYRFYAEGEAPRFLFTNNETNAARLWGAPNRSPYVKDAFHEYVVNGSPGVINLDDRGTKCAPHYRVTVASGSSATIRLRLCNDEHPLAEPIGAGFEALFQQRAAEADLFYSMLAAPEQTAQERIVFRQAYAGMLWTKQFYHFVVRDWLAGDPGQPAPPEARTRGRNAEWARHLYNRDIISMPDTWEYPWYAAWDLAFHSLPFARLDPTFAKGQLELMLREWYMHPNGQLPAYEWNFSDVNPPVHAWAAWRVYKMSAPKGQRDRRFLAHVFLKLLMNFTWWVNRKDDEGNNLFSGGFLGLDNIGVFDRSKPLPTGGHLEQADGTAWMAFYCTTMFGIAVELARTDPEYEDLASKFFEHFVAIADATNHLGGSGLWDDTDGFYYDQLHVDGKVVPLRVRSMVGIIPLFAVEVLDDELLSRMPNFRKRLHWFLDNRPELAEHIAYMSPREGSDTGVRRLLAVPTRDRLVGVLRYVLDEAEFLSPHGVRSLSKVHGDDPFEIRVGDDVFRVGYVPGESDTGMFGGNSNWRGPIWFPVNFLLIEALERYHHYYGDELKVECPTGSGVWMTLQEVADELSRRLRSLFLPDQHGSRPCHGADARFADDPNWSDLLLFHEYFHGDTGKGLGASHQTGWTGLLVTRA